MVSVLVWTTYVVAAVVVVLYGLAAGFVAFLRCALDPPLGKPLPDPCQVRLPTDPMMSCMEHAASPACNGSADVIMLQRVLQMWMLLKVWRRHPGRGQEWGEPRVVHDVLHAWCRQRRLGPDTPEFFLTARNSVGTFRIAWSFYAAAMGSWTLFSPAQYANSAGYTPHAANYECCSLQLELWHSNLMHT